MLAFSNELCQMNKSQYAYVKSVSWAVQRIKSSEFLAMPREKNPVFRRAIIPWYDSNRVCWIVVGLMITIVIFSVVGIFAALEDPRFQSYFWLPLLLLMMSAGIAVSTLMRMFRRYIDRLSR